ncbi:MAG: class I SAM-dependent methyltransferase [Candidatus Parvarchaeota archaeon]|nr:class I SAM-dependent methyltransferase [Candidatus Jingweiarchaeum tengchongense]MCW1298485.1 class I SAM-dependent methyltransferase [Candidatus Jingweiarchaeum tengchongense]MCW1300269.1 class I SAM-dependent methyltransferase [Candidatus Jingweiarchaeum tengchongense]MCW1304497.1 class I SAM-dependent methyltransferase [Candidatus Jingweiarchaeum tengchongense]MCW1305775.1 class I SAM-dependent methyltransferase [Candidatus Jingweiarchaeum tengchongense]
MSKKKEVLKVYESIAEAWDRLRRKPYAELYHFLDEVSNEVSTGKVIDVGCGNARNGIEFAKKGFDVFCVDISRKMIEIARKNAEKERVKMKFVVADVCALPFKENSFDVLLSIAVIHHLEENERIKALNEMKRVMKDGGIGLISVWHRNYIKYILKFAPKYLSQKIIGNSGDMYIPWKTKEKVFYRFYHLFSLGEFKKELLRSGIEILKIFPEKKAKFKSFIFSRNIFAKIKK